MLLLFIFYFNWSVIIPIGQSRIFFDRGSGLPQFTHAHTRIPVMWAYDVPIRIRGHDRERWGSYRLVVKSFYSKRLSIFHPKKPPPRTMRKNKATFASIDINQLKYYTRRTFFHYSCANMLEYMLYMFWTLYNFMYEGWFEVKCRKHEKDLFLNVLVTNSN